MKILKSIKLTPLFVVLFFIEFLLIVMAMYFLATSSGGSGLGGVILFIGALINIILIFIEQVIANIKGINRNILWAAEIIIITIVAYYFWENGISIG